MRVACPFCRGSYTLPDPEDLERGKADPVLMHSMPPCDKWTALDPVAFLEEARLTMEPN